MQPQIDNLIELLKDGKWHTVEELSQKTKLHEFKLAVLFDFLADYSFLRIDKRDRKAKLSRVFLEFLRKERSD